MLTKYAVNCFHSRTLEDRCWSELRDSIASPAHMYVYYSVYKQMCMPTNMCMYK